MFFEVRIWRSGRYGSKSGQIGPPFGALGLDACHGNGRLNHQNAHIMGNCFRRSKSMVLACPNMGYPGLVVLDPGLTKFR